MKGPCQSLTSQSFTLRTSPYAYLLGEGAFCKTHTYPLAKLIMHVGYGWRAALIHVHSTCRGKQALLLIRQAQVQLSR